MEKPKSYINGRGEAICTRCGKIANHKRCGLRSGSNISEEELQVEAEILVRHHWKREFSGSIALVEHLPHGIQGQYLPGEQIILMSRKKNSKRDRATVISYLLHELVHWHMDTSGLPSRDRDPDFAAECLRVGAPISGADHAQDALKEVEMAERMELFGFSAEGEMR